MTYKIPLRYYYNPGDNDVVIADISVTIRAGRVIELFTHNPTLTYSAVLRSEAENGMLYKFCRSEKLIRLSEAPVANTAPNFTPLSVATTPIPSRAKSCLIMDQSQKNFMDKLHDDFLEQDGLSTLSDTERAKINEKFIRDVDLDGFEE